MIATSEQHNTFHSAAQPLIEWLRTNCHPHVLATVDCESAELLEGVCTVGRQPPQPAPDPVAESAAPAVPDGLLESAGNYDGLHIAVCQAVALMNRTPSRDPEFHEAHTILRLALLGEYPK